MCGIVGYIGGRQATDFLLAGLSRLEYRGYDSSGVATIGVDGRFSLVKAAGKLERLKARLESAPAEGRVGIGHTRWATHGPATDANAHPHFGGEEVLAVVHNGVIENYLPLKESLAARGYRFESQTDTEVIAHLIADELKSLDSASGARGDSATDASRDSERDPHCRLVAATRSALAKLHGAYGLAVLFRDDPNVLIAARLGSPLVVGVGRGEHFLASDASPLVGFAERIVYLADRQIAVLTADSLRVLNHDEEVIVHDAIPLAMDSADVDRGDYPSYMLKEIFEQPVTIANTMRGRLLFDEGDAHFGGLNLSREQLSETRRLVLSACGTSWHAALVGEHLFERLARLPVEVEYASELRYRDPPFDPHTLAIVITQSGETADTLAALRELKRREVPSLAICNVVGSSIAMEAQGGVYLHAGPEIGVASTKAFSSQCVALAMLALHFGRMRGLSKAEGSRIIDRLRELPELAQETLKTNAETARIAAKYHQCRDFLFLGRQFNFPVALEGALKLKEISYIHAEGYPAAEMKHGPIALVDAETPSVFIVPYGPVFEKAMSNIEEIKARGGPVIALTCPTGAAAEGGRLAKLADDLILVPACEDYLQPIVCNIPLQLLAYHVASLRGCDVDKPRNLAKSVTVE